MDDFGGVGRKWHAFLVIFFSDHLKNAAKLGERRLASRHQGVTARESRDFRDPGTIILTVENRLVVVQRHSSYPFLSVAV
jgi:hypothetical protein